MRTTYQTSWKNTYNYREVAERYINSKINKKNKRVNGNEKQRKKKKRN